MRKTWLIGSSQGCDIRIDSPYVSGKHCELSYDGLEWQIEDLGSTNGTYIDGVRLNGKSKVSPARSVTLGKLQPLPWPVVPDGSSDRVGSRIGLRTDTLRLVIGRASECDVVLEFPMVSSRHAVIDYSDHKWFIRDLGSTNGTYLQGKRITGAVEVHPGDVVGLGSHRLQLVEGTADQNEQIREAPVSLEAEGISVHVHGKPLIAGITVSAKPGEVVAIIGPSGSGKSTLIASLVGYLNPSVGHVRLQGCDLYRHGEEFRGQIGYVPQDDIMHADLTVRQALRYAAKLRLPVDYSREEIDSRIDRVLARLKIKGIEHNRIGSATRRGISGGQRKRVNVAMELLTDPAILVLDEPTSGLSSTDALSIVRLLRELADAGTSVVLTIHQPSREIVSLIDLVAVLAKDDSSEDVGRLVWFGPPADAAVFFDCQQTQGDLRTADSILYGLEQMPVAHWQQRYAASATSGRWIEDRHVKTKADDSVPQPRAISLTRGIHQWLTLVQRAVAVKTSDIANTAILLLQAPLIALLIVLTFREKAISEPSAGTWTQLVTATSMISFLLALAAIWFGCSNSVRELVAERAILRREYMAGLGANAYLASKIAVMATLCLLQCVVLGLVVGVGCRLSGSLSYLLLILFVSANVGVALGLCVSALARSTEAAAAALPLMILPLVMLGGALLPVFEMPGVAAVAADAMPSRWAFEAALINEASARPLFEAVSPDDAAVRLIDIAESHFPAGTHRASEGVPLTVLAVLWVLSLLALQLLFRRRAT